MDDDPLLRRDEFVHHGIPRDVFMYYARKAQDLRQQAFCHALRVMLRWVGIRPLHKIGHTKEGSEAE
jgi:hypothetical protein